MVVKVVKVVPMGVNTKKIQGVMIKSIVNSRGGGGRLRKNFLNMRDTFFYWKSPMEILQNKKFFTFITRLHLQFHKLFKNVKKIS